MNSKIVYYRPYGEPATALITVNTTRTLGDKVTIGGQDFTLGTHFHPGYTPQECAEDLCKVINADPTNASGYDVFQPIRPYFAIYYGNRVRLVATAPGTAGNAITLTASGGGFTISSPFSGGTTITP